MNSAFNAGSVTHDILKALAFALVLAIALTWLLLATATKIGRILSNYKSRHKPRS